MSAEAADALLAILPYARRYARALTGSQREGDAIVGRALAALETGRPAREALYAGITRLTAAQPESRSTLGVVARQLLLLTSLEALPMAEAARILGLAEADAEQRLDQARDALRSAAVADVLIIEDEPLIAMHLSVLIEECGHRVVGVASSEAAAIRLAAEKGAGLILADVNLGRGGSGIVAVRRILETMPVPVIFVTAYPEALLTAERAEPAFVINKPFDPVTLAIATYQAITAGRVPLT